MRRWIPTIVVALICTTALGWVQFSFEGLIGGDSYFHTRAARELDRHGIRKTFPQTVHSTWNDRYSDKDLLFHLGLIPFQRWSEAGRPAEGGGGDEDLVTPGKRAVVFFNLLFFGALAFALHAIGARFAAFWLLLFFVADAPILYRFVLVRPGLLGVSFVLAEIALIVRRRSMGVAVAGALHTLAHSSFVLLPGLGLAAWLAHRMRRERFPLPVLAATVVGPLVASVFHPYAPNNLYVAWDQIVEVARSVWWPRAEIPSFLFGTELLAVRTDQFLGSFPAFLPAVAAVAAFLAFPRQRLSTVGLALVFASGLLLVAGFLSERFLAFFFPVVVVTGARLWTELAGEHSLMALLRRSPARLLSTSGLLALCVIAGLADGSVLLLKLRTQRLATLENQRPAVTFLRNVARPDELVYHSFWWDFAALYHYRPDGRYVVALDPVFFYRYDPERFAKALAAHQGASDDLYRVLREDFGADWVYIPLIPRYYPLFDLVRRDPRFQRAYEDDHVAIARLTP